MSLRSSTARGAIVLALGLLLGCGGGGGGDDDRSQVVPTASATVSASASVTPSAVPTSTPMPIGPVAFAVSNRQVVRSDDGGRTWSLAFTADETMVLQGVAFADADHGWVVGGTTIGFGTALFHTEDGGRTWVDQLPNITGLTGGPMVNFGFFDVAFTSPSHGVAVGSDDQHPAVFAPPALVIVTDDSGVTWRVADTPRSLGTLRSVCLRPSGHGIAVGHAYHEGGFIMTTIDGGQTWKAGGRGDGVYEDFTPTNATCAGTDSFVISGTNFSDSPTGYDATIRYLPAIGSPWFDRTPLVANASGEAVPLTFVDAMVGWAVTDRVIHRTGSAGVSWNRSRLPGGDGVTYRAVAFRSRDHGMVVGGVSSGPRAVLTSDGGATWSEGTFPPDLLPLPLVDVVVVP
jgi:photosystem II stability/assembly factor-like uncharacterized protein